MSEPTCDCECRLFVLRCALASTPWRHIVRNQTHNLSRTIKPVSQPRSLLSLQVIGSQFCLPGIGSTVATTTSCDLPERERQPARCRGRTRLVPSIAKSGGSSEPVPAGPPSAVNPPATRCQTQRRTPRKSRCESPRDAQCEITARWLCTVSPHEVYHPRSRHGVTIRGHGTRSRREVTAAITQSSPRVLLRSCYIHLSS